MQNVFFSSLLMLACAMPTRAAEPNELELVRPDAKSFVSVRVAEVAKKFDLETWLEKAGADKIPQLKNVRDWWAGPLSELTRITQVHLGDSYCGCVHIFQTAKGCDRDKILAHLVPEGKWIEFEGGKYLISAKGEPSGHFAVFYLDDERTIMSHSPDAIRKFLVKPQVERPAKPGFHDALKAAETKDIAAWHDAAGQKVMEDNDGKFGGLEAVAGSVQFGDKVLLEGTGYFALEEQTKIGEIFARTYLKQARMMLLSVSYSGEAEALTNRKADPFKLWPGAVALVDSLEKDLQVGKLESNGKAVTLSLTLSVGPKAIKTHAEGIAQADASIFAGFGMINRYASDEEVAKMAEINRAMDAKSPPPSSAVPSPEDMKRRATEMGIAPPQYFPADPSGVAQGTAPPTVLPVLPQPVAPVQPQAVLLPTGATEPAPALPMASPWLLTIVNTRAEAALLFEVGSNATLDFRRKIAPGKLFDAPTFQGARWVVVFSEKPGSQNYTVGSEKIWLLREPEKLDGNNK